MELPTVDQLENAIFAFSFVDENSSVGFSNLSGLKCKQKTFYPFFNGQNQESDHAHRLQLKLETEREGKKNKMLFSLLRLPW